VTNKSLAQDQPYNIPALDSPNNTSTTSGAGLNVPHGNPLQGLFTPQPQFPTAQTHSNPDPKTPAAGELNPLKGLFTPQPQFVTPQTKMNSDAEPPPGEVNHLKGFFTPSKQFETPQTIQNPQPKPANLVPERQLLWGAEEQRQNLIRQHNLNTFGVENPLNSNRARTSNPTQPNKNTPTNTQRSKAATNKPGTAAASAAAHAVVETPSERKEKSALRNALNLLHQGKNEECLRALDLLLSENPNDAQAHYIKGVALVTARRYNDAAEEYQAVIQQGRGDGLESLARDGLKKIKTK